MSEKNLKDKFKLFLILIGILIPVAFLLPIVVNLVKGNPIITNMNAYFYGIGVIIMVTSIPSLYRREYSTKGVYRKMMTEMFTMKKTGYEDTNVETKSYEDESPFSTGLFIVLAGFIMLLIGFMVERIFNII